MEVGGVGGEVEAGAAGGGGLAGEDGEEAWQVHATGRMRRGARQGAGARPVDESELARIRERCGEALDQEEFYALLAAHEIDLGRAFRWVERLWRRDGEVLARFRVPLPADREAGSPLPLAWRGILAGVLLAFARAMGEFGATLMVAGSIAGQTQTLSIAVYEAVQAGQDDTANFLVAVTSVVCIAVLLGAGRLAPGRVAPRS